MSIFLSFHASHAKCMKVTTNLAKNLKHVRFNNLQKTATRNFSTQEDVTENKPKRSVPFFEEVNRRREEAKRSVLVQVQSSQSFKELHTYCSSFGDVKQMFHYTSGVEPLNFILVEFAQESEVKNVLTSATHIQENQFVPIQSQFLWFRANNRKLAKLKINKNCKLACEDGTKIVKNPELLDLLKTCVSISDQMSVLHNATKLNDIGTRLRYLTAKQIETMLYGMFPNATVYPFGSSVNGCGKMGCDLDLVLRLDEIKENDSSRLIYHCKGSSGSDRSMSQRQMEAISDLILLFLPGCTQVRRILQARVPIIKFHQQLTDTDCDLSMINMSGVYMSNFLYIMGSIDERVRPLIFTIRKWAEAVSLTNSSPGRWISNFSLTLLVLAFLQKPLNSEPILPSLNTLTKLAEPKDKYVTEDGINCTFLQDINKLKHKTQNKESLESLLKEFFEFYSQFDFSSKAVCLNEAVALTKPEHSAMYIINPLERGLNVSKNVSLEELNKFQTEVRNAAWQLESQENNLNWGLLSLFEKKPQKTNPFFSISKQSRLMEVSTLFEEEGEKVEYKNKAVAKEVENIKQKTQEKIKQMENSLKRQNSHR